MMVEDILQDIKDLLFNKLSFFFFFEKCYIYLQHFYNKSYIVNCD